MRIPITYHIFGLHQSQFSIGAALPPQDSITNGRLCQRELN
jgi:hypothetical protein